jgi:signal transduction histidine kinase
MQHSYDENRSDTTTQLARFEAATEKAKTQLSRSLHDDLGGLLVSAIMDTAWAEQHLVDCPDVRDRLRRVRDSLAAAVDLKRTMIENLRPSLLENFGLIAALRWYHKHNCRLAAISCSENYPAEEPPFTPEAATSLFRIVQEALTLTTSGKSVKNAHLGLRISHDTLCIQITHDGEATPPERRNEADRLAVWLLEHRIHALGGVLHIANPAAGGMKLGADIPLRNLLVA